MRTAEAGKDDMRLAVRLEVDKIVVGRFVCAKCCYAALEKHVLERQMKLGGQGG